MAKKTIFGLAGDVLVDRDDPPEVFELVQPMLDATDLLFANLEGPYTDNPVPAVSAPVQVTPGIKNLDVYARCGFDVVSMANNHIVDAGHEAMLDTERRLEEQGVATCGTGANINAARKPAFVEVDGLNVAFLSYACLFPNGYEARSNMPGVAPMRARNLYHESVPNYHMPGVPGKLTTVPYDEDVRDLEADIAGAREQADLVICTFHWGDFMKPFHLTDHEKRTARFSIDNGADMVVGHHHHVLRGMEWYNGKPIMYGLGHFVFDLRTEFSKELMDAVGGMGDDPEFYGVAPREGWPLLPLHAESRMTALAWATVDDGKIDDIGFVPCRLQPDGRVRPVDVESEEGQEVIDYVAKGCETQRLNGRIEAGGIELGGHASVRLVPTR